MHSGDNTERLLADNFNAFAQISNQDDEEPQLLIPETENTNTDKENRAVFMNMQNSNPNLSILDKGVKLRSTFDKGLTLPNKRVMVSERDKSKDNIGTESQPTDKFGGFNALLNSKKSFQTNQNCDKEYDEAKDESLLTQENIPRMSMKRSGPVRHDSLPKLPISRNEIDQADEKPLVLDYIMNVDSIHTDKNEEDDQEIHRTNEENPENITRKLKKLTSIQKSCRTRSRQQIPDVSPSQELTRNFLSFQVPSNFNKLQFAISGDAERRARRLFSTTKLHKADTMPLSKGRNYSETSEVSRGSSDQLGSRFLSEGNSFNKILKSLKRVHSKALKSASDPKNALKRSNFK